MLENISEKVCVVVVTYNRKELLKECLDAILKQSYPVEKIVLINNASTDGTQNMLNEDGYTDMQVLEHVLMEKNLGGSGGFYEGIKRAKAYSCDWIWVMDDDTIPCEDCLEKLILANQKIVTSPVIEGMEQATHPSFLASSIYGAEGEFMNLPEINMNPSPNGYAYWYKFLNQGIVNISSATFVSVLIRKDAVERCGLPCKDYFIWGDDTEYTTRLTKNYGDGYFVGNSVAIHKRIGAKSLSINNEQNPKRIDMYSYLYRNQAINKRYYSSNMNIIRFLKYYISGFLFGIKQLKQPMGLRKLKAIWKGYMQSILCYRKFEMYINQQLGKK